MGKAGELVARLQALARPDNMDLGWREREAARKAATLLASQEAEIEALTARALAAEARVAEAVERLEPFAKEADRYDPVEDDGEYIPWDKPDWYRVNDLRAARDFIARTQKDNPHAK